MSILLTVKILLSAMLGTLVSRRLMSLVFTRLALVGLYGYYVSLTVASLAFLQLVWAFL